MKDKKLNILIVTQVVDENDWLLGFFTKWLAEFSSFFKEVFVCTLRAGNYDLPENVKIIEIKKKNNPGKTNILKILYSTVFKIKKEKGIDCIFIHMCPVYALVLVPFKVLFKIPIVIWYIHCKATLKLRIAHLICNKIITASRQSFPLKSKKIVVAGHGIDTATFDLKNYGKQDKIIKILSAGRIAPVKRLEVLIEALKKLKDSGKVKFKCIIAGDVLINKHRDYCERLKRMIKNCGLTDMVKFIGPVLHQKIGSLYKSCDVLVSLTDVGSYDKAVLEAMSSGLLIITNNGALKKLLMSNLEDCFINENSPHKLVQRIEKFSAMPADKKNALGLHLRNIVVEQHKLENCVSNIYTALESCIKK
ncbi:MAG: glycosyltransferase family 4 protein [Candidatus Aureabacteria bacterium]|nr:glycosyltransferase family 4 protein [Candidatus Auribacterota bacterium]